MYRKLLTLAATLVLVAGFTYNANNSVNQVGAMEVSAASASVAKGFLCGVLIALTTDSHATLSNSGNETLTCHGSNPAYAGDTVVLRGLLCGLFFSGLTTNSQLTITKSGNANLRCQT